MSLIRKISVGSGYPENAVHYRVDSEINLGRVKHIITSIEDLGEEYAIYVADKKNPTLSVYWKGVNKLMPIVKENKIDFE